MDVNAANTEECFIIADQPLTTLQGQVLWADTEAPVPNAVVSRAWYPWELYPSDMSMTLDRFEVETDEQGVFKFSNLTEARYQLHIRAVHAVFEDTPERYHRTLVYKQVTIPTAGTTYRIYLGKTRWHTFFKVVGTFRVPFTDAFFKVEKIFAFSKQSLSSAHLLFPYSGADAVLWEDHFEAGGERILAAHRKRFHLDG